MKTRKVLFVVPYFPPHKGGMELVARNIAEQLSRNHTWQVVVVTTGEERAIEVEKADSGLVVYRLPYWRKISNSPVALSWLWHLRRIIQRSEEHTSELQSPC